MVENLTNKLKSVVLSNKFALGLVFIGITLRLKQFFENRSLWLDEAYVAISVTSRSFSEILRFIPIFPEQPQTPVGFTLVERVFVSAMGNNEYALRLFPLMAGILSIILFYCLLKRCANAYAVPLALGIFVFCDALIYYSAEVKPYSSDVLASIILYLSWQYTQSTQFSKKSLILFGIAGSLIVWFSFPSIFLLGTFALVLTGSCMFKKSGLKIIYLISILGAWLISVGVLYMVSLRSMVGSEYIVDAWGHLAFGQEPYFSLKNLFWARDVLVEIFNRPLGISNTFICSVFFIVGLSVMQKEKRELCFVLIMPLLFALFAASIRKYPFADRMLLFAVPSLIIILSKGALALLGWVPKGRKIAGLIIVMLLFHLPVSNASLNLMHNRVFEENRVVMEYFRDHYVPGDAIFMNTSAQFPFWYYAGKLKFSGDLHKESVGYSDEKWMRGVRVGQFSRYLGSHEGQKYTGYKFNFHVFDDDGFYRSLMTNDLTEQQYIVFANTMTKPVESPRAWLILSRVDPAIGDIIKKYFRNVGKELQAFEKKGAAIYLFDFKS